nr:hypothetical protein Iba_scaffold116524CG0010 [Ipomoea batatas]GMD42838.1 hypothetical protein Iba_scaffold116525CG0010 [Ipomoea batatas]
MPQMSGLLIREFPVHMVRRLHLKHIQVARLFHVSNSRLHFRQLNFG